MQKKNTTKGIIFLVTAAVVWGFAFVAQRLGSDHVGAFTFNGARFLLGTLSLIPVILLFEKNEHDAQKMKTTLFCGGIAGILLFAASSLQQIGIDLTDSAGKSGFITGLYMILVPIIGIFIGKKTNIQSWIGAVFGVVGLGLICLDGGALTITAGDAVLMLSAIVFAIHIIVIDHFGDNIYSLRFSMTQFAVCTVINWILALFTEDISFATILSAGIPIAYCGFMSVGVAYTCQVIGLKYSDPTSGSIILSTESVFAAIGGAIILHERMAPLAYLGCVLILAGIILTQLKFKEL
ncbi:MAG: DMT family transporter [Clostridia bacterium]|nr:DMT family transporter [Clostridia bacterium]